MRTAVKKLIMKYPASEAVKRWPRSTEKLYDQMQRKKIAKIRDEKNKAAAEKRRLEKGIVR